MVVIKYCNILVMWGLIVSAIGVYNIAKGVYNIYKDANGVKKQYREYQSKTREYKYVQRGDKKLTDTQYVRHRDQFIII